MAGIMSFISNGFSTQGKGAGLSVHAANSGLQHLHSNLFSAKNIVRTDIVLPWRGVEQGPALAFTLDNVFTPDECKTFIALTEATGYGQALVNVGGGRQQLMEDVRNNTRCMIDDPIVAQIIFERIAPFLPASYDSPNGHRSAPVPCALTCLNERLRFLKYTRGQKFAPHNDGTYVRPYTAENPVPERSFVTVQLYLNDGGGKDFEGGSTAFLNPSQRFLREDEVSNDPADIVHCEPRVGRVLCFQHNLLHQGSEVTAGTKYCLRTDAMFQPPKQASSSSSSAPAPAAAAAAAALMAKPESEAKEPGMDEEGM